MLTKEDLASRLQGREYRREMTKAEEAEAKAAGLVVIFGASDDNVEIRGAADDELGACDGSEVLFTPAGLLRNDCTDYDCPYFAQLKSLAAPVTCHWGRDGWSYSSNIPHATFEVFDEGSVCCRGLVFSLKDVHLAQA